MSENDERALINQAKRDPKAFGALYRRYVNQIYAYACRRTGSESLAQDITATTFEAAIRNLGEYEYQGSSFLAWLYTLARNKIADHYRRERWLVPIKKLQGSYESPEMKILAEDQKAMIQVALSHLKQKDQDILILRFYDELSSAEVADILGISKDNVYLRLHRALKRLHHALETLQEETGERYA